MYVCMYVCICITKLETSVYNIGRDCMVATYSAQSNIIISGIAYLVYSTRAAAGKMVKW